MAVTVAYDDYFLVGFKPFQHSLLSSFAKERIGGNRAMPSCTLFGATKLEAVPK